MAICSPLPMAAPSSLWGHSATRRDFPPPLISGSSPEESYPGLKIDYAPVGQRWSVLSGTRGDMMIYEKVIFSCGGKVINSFALVYPIAERMFYDPIVETIEDSFRPGAARCDQHAATF